MTSLVTSQGDFNVAPQYYLRDEKIYFRVITEKRTVIISLNLVYICIMGLQIWLYKLLWIMPLMTSSGPQISKNLNCNSSFNIWAKASMKSSKCRKYSWLHFWHIQLPGSLPAKCLLWHQNGGHFENVKIVNTVSIWNHIWIDRPKLYKKKYCS